LSAKAPPQQLAALEEFGRCVGLAFQITDDLLDVNGNMENIGKQVKKDAKKNKLTFPSLLGLDQSISHAGQLIDNACEAISSLGNRAAGLEVLARYIVERNR
jgi:geranylgeranyl pyrophosphate synthase